MDLVSLLAQYLLWHYTRALADILSIFRNFLWFVGHFFSMGMLVRTFFSPWKRLGEVHRHEGLSNFFSGLAINVLMRIVGCMIRLATLLMGLVCLVAVGILGTAFLAAWIFAPMVLVALAIAGIQQFIRLA